MPRFKVGSLVLALLVNEERQEPAIVVDSDSDTKAKLVMSNGDIRDVSFSGIRPLTLPESERDFQIESIKEKFRDNLSKMKAIAWTLGVE